VNHAEGLRLRTRIVTLRHGVPVISVC